MLVSRWLTETNCLWPFTNPKKIFSERKEKARENDIHLTPSQIYGVLPQSEYIEKSGNRVVLNLTGAENMKHVQPGDYIIHLRSFQGGLECSQLAGKVSNAYTVISPKIKISQIYFKWVLKSSGFIQELSSLTDQLRDGQSIKFEQFAKISLPFPSLEEQMIIGDYLDAVDKKVSKALELLSSINQKFFEIDEALMQDLFPFDRSSSLEKILKTRDYKGWSMLPLHALGSKISHDGFPQLEPLSVYLNLGVIPRASRDDNKNNLGRDLTKYQRVENGDLVFNKLRTWQGGFGIAKQEGIVSPAYYIFRFKSPEIVPEYVDILMKSPLYLSTIKRFTKWMPPSQFDTSWEDLKQLPIFYPKVEKQLEIVQEAEKIKTRREFKLHIDQLKNHFKELRVSLIEKSVVNGIDSRSALGANL